MKEFVTGLFSTGFCADTSVWQIASGRQTVKVEDRYMFGAALLMIVTSAAYLMLAGQ